MGCWLSLFVHHLWVISPGSLCITYTWKLMQKMILENGEYDLSKLFGLIAELGESLNENRSLSVSLYAQANNVKVGCVAEGVVGC
jgi:hypothetical protein